MNSTFSKSSGDEQPYPQLDLSGKLIIKAQLGDDVRRIPIHNEAITYDELVLMMQRVFRSKLSSSDDITIKYKDEDGDLITIFDSSDLAFAVQYSRILKLQILVGGENAQRNVVPVQIRGIRRELQKIRDQVNNLLDTLEPCGTEVSSSTIDVRSNPGDQNSAVSHLSSREFDPLQDQAQRQAAADRDSGAKDDTQMDVAVRGNTPDSMGSSGSRRVSSGMDQMNQSQPPQQTQQQQQPPPPQQQPPPPQSQQQPLQPPPLFQQPQGFQPGEQPPPQQQQNNASSQQQTQTQQPPQQQQQSQPPFQGGGYSRFPVPGAFVGGTVMGQQPQMMVQAPGQQPVPQNAFRPPYQPYPGVQQTFSPGPQGAPTGYRPPTPSQQGQVPVSQAYPQDFSVPQGAYPFPTMPQQANSNPYSSKAASSGFNRPPSQQGYQ